MKYCLFIVSWCLLFQITGVWAQEKGVTGPADPESCTSIMVGKLASTDGSVMTSHTCDGGYRTWVEMVPAADHKAGSMRPVYWGKMHTQTSKDMYKVSKKGEIPQVKHTYAFLNTSYPCLNEKQLAIGETTITGRRELHNDKGLFVIEELQAIALERCSTAREAIRVMGELAEKYGYGDWGECLTIADPKEVWHFEITGAGKEEVGALWAAQRIPDDHVGISANIPRISTIDFEDKDHFMTSANLREKAKKLGFWDGKEPFKFYKVISKGKPFSIREFYVLSTLAPSLNLSYDAEELPFSVKPEHKISPQEVMRYYRETYEGTPWDMTKGLMVTKKLRNRDGSSRDTLVKSPVAQPWMSSDLITLLNTLRPDVIKRQRTVAVSWCAYSHIIQCRDWLPDEIGAVAWFSMDNPGESPRVPIFSGITRLPKSFGVCGQLSYRDDAALWTYRRTNRLAQVNWAKGRALIEPAVLAFENKALAEMPGLEARVKQLVSEGKRKEARAEVTRYTNDFAYATLRQWEELEAQLWEMFGRGF